MTKIQSSPSLHHHQKKIQWFTSKKIKSAINKNHKLQHLQQQKHDHSLQEKKFEDFRNSRNKMHQKKSYHNDQCIEDQPPKSHQNCSEKKGNSFAVGEIAHHSHNKHILRMLKMIMEGTFVRGNIKWPIEVAVGWGKK